MPFSHVATFDVLRTLANGSISANYAKVGSIFAHPVRAIRLVNATDGDMFFTINGGSTPASDGSTDMFFVPAGSFVLWDVSSDQANQTNSPAFEIAKGSQIWVRQSSAPTTKSVFAECLFAVGE